MKQSLKNAQEENAILLSEDNKLRKVDRIFIIKYFSRWAQITRQTVFRGEF